MGSDELAKLYGRFAEKDMNILQARVAEVHTPETPETLAKTWRIYLLVLEYGYKKKDSDKLIWPKIAVEGHSLEVAAKYAEQLVDSIREA